MSAFSTYGARKHRKEFFEHERRTSLISAGRRPCRLRADGCELVFLCHPVADVVRVGLSHCKPCFVLDKHQSRFADDCAGFLFRAPSSTNARRVESSRQGKRSHGVPVILPNVVLGCQLDTFQPFLSWLLSAQAVSRFIYFCDATATHALADPCPNLLDWIGFTGSGNRDSQAMDEITGSIAIRQLASGLPTCPSSAS